MILPQPTSTTQISGISFPRRYCFVLSGTPYLVCCLVIHLSGHEFGCQTVRNVDSNQSELTCTACKLQEEGIIIKALDSPWQMNDRSNAWLKIKPDYVHSNDIDAVIIGAFYGTGRHGGLVTQWLLALAEATPGGAKDTPTNFMSFCK